MENNYNLMGPSIPTVAGPMTCHLIISQTLTPRQDIHTVQNEKIISLPAVFTDKLNDSAVISLAGTMHESLNILQLNPHKARKRCYTDRWGSQDTRQRPNGAQWEEGRCLILLGILASQSGTSLPSHPGNGGYLVSFHRVITWTKTGKTWKSLMQCLGHMDRKTMDFLSSMRAEKTDK